MIRNETATDILNSIIEKHFHKAILNIQNAEPGSKELKLYNIVENLKADLIENAYELSSHNHTHAANLLSVGRTTLPNLVKKYCPHIEIKSKKTNSVYCNICNKYFKSEDTSLPNHKCKEIE